MKKALIIISILVGIFVLGSLNSQKVFSYQDCGNYSCTGTNNCPAGFTCGFDNKQCCCSNGCNACFPNTCNPPPPAAPPPVVVPPTATPIPTATPVPCPKKAQGDANCDGTVNLLDYFYYVTVASGGRVPSTVNPDFNGNGTVNAEDRVIIIRTLKP